MSEYKDLTDNDYFGVYRIYGRFSVTGPAIDGEIIKANRCKASGSWFARLVSCCGSGNGIIIYIWETDIYDNAKELHDRLSRIEGLTVRME